MGALPRTRNKNVIGQRLKEARRKCNPPLTQDQLSGKLATLGVLVDRVAIAKIEGGNRCVYDFELRGLARALRIDVRWLLGLGDGRPRTEQRSKQPRGRK